MAAAAVPLIASGISALAGLFGGRGKTANTYSSQHQTQSGERFYNQRQGYELSPFQQQLAQMFTQGAMDQYKQSANLAPYATQQMQTIAGQGTANAKVMNNILAQRGLSFSPAAATGLTQNAINTGNQMSQFTAGLPMLQQQLRSGALSQLMSAFSTLPTTTTMDGYETSRQSGDMSGTNVNQSSGNMLGGLFTGLGAGLFSPTGAAGSPSNMDKILAAFKNARTPRAPNPYSTGGLYDPNTQPSG